MVFKSRPLENLIADFRRLPIDDGRSVRKEVSSIHSVLEAIIEQYDIGKPRLQEVIIQRWQYIMGEQMSHRCSPERIAKGNQLIITVGSHVLRQEIEFNKWKILARLKQIPECSKIQSIKVVSIS